MKPRFAGRVAIVTGGASGIGRGIAGRLAAEGAAVLVADRNGAAGEEVVARLGGEEARCAFQETDVTQESDCARMVAAAVDRWGGVDVLVNSAGIGDGAPVHELEETRWDRVLDVNLKGVFLCCKAALPALATRGGGAIVNIASLAGMVAAPGFGAYAASKAGVMQLTKVLAVEGARQGVRANAVCPIWVETPLLEGYLAGAPNPAAARRGMEAQIPLGRIGTVDDVAAAVLFLASDEASYITGVSLPIDGGALCQ
jgi:meso-butanediol dehydrogenase / (S,S)-butanediol dehydrogenase / diacetyl reductase